MQVCVHGCNAGYVCICIVYYNPKKKGLVAMVNRRKLNNENLHTHNLLATLHACYKRNDIEENEMDRHVAYIGKAVPLRHAGAKGERSYSFYSFMTSALDGVSGQRHAPAALYPRERTPRTHWVGGWVGLRDGLDTEARG
jgi:hypothetical protein